MSMAGVRVSAPGKVTENYPGDSFRLTSSCCLYPTSSETYMNESRGNNNAGSELLQNHKDDIVLCHPHEGGCENRAEDADSARHKDNEEKANSKRYIIVTVGALTARGISFSLSFADAMPERSQSHRTGDLCMQLLTLLRRGNGSVFVHLVPRYAHAPLRCALLGRAPRTRQEPGLLHRRIQGSNYGHLVRQRCGFYRKLAHQNGP